MLPGMMLHMPKTPFFVDLGGVTAWLNFSVEYVDNFISFDKNIHNACCANRPRIM